MLWIRKRHILLFLMLVGGILFTLNFHVIRVNNTDFDVIKKEKMTFNDVYVDVRNWVLVDYFYHSPKIRNYLFFEKPYNRLLVLIEEKKEEMEKNCKNNSPLCGSETKKHSPLEKTIHDWIDNILN